MDGNERMREKKVECLFSLKVADFFLSSIKWKAISAALLPFHTPNILDVI